MPLIASAVLAAFTLSLALARASSTSFSCLALSSVVNVISLLIFVFSAVAFSSIAFFAAVITLSFSPKICSLVISPVFSCVYFVTTELIATLSLLLPSSIIPWSYANFAALVCFCFSEDFNQLS